MANGSAEYESLLETTIIETTAPDMSYSRNEYDEIDIDVDEICDWPDLFEQDEGHYVEQVDDRVIIHSWDNDPFTLDDINRMR